MAVLIARLRAVRSTTPSPAARSCSTSGSGSRSINGLSAGRAATKNPRAPSRLATSAATRSASTSSLSSPRSHRASRVLACSIAAGKDSSVMVKERAGCHCQRYGIEPRLRQR